MRKLQRPRPMRTSHFSRKKTKRPRGCTSQVLVLYLYCAVVYLLPPKPNAFRRTLISRMILKLEVLFYTFNTNGEINATSNSTPQHAYSSYNITAVRSTFFLKKKRNIALALWSAPKIRSCHNNKPARMILREEKK